MSAMATLRPQRKAERREQRLDPVKKLLDAGAVEHDFGAFLASTLHRDSSPPCIPLSQPQRSWVQTTFSLTR